MFIIEDFRNTVVAADECHSASPGLFQRTAEAFTRFSNRRKTRRMLDLSPHLLNDIGLTRDDVMDALTSPGDPADILNARRQARCAEIGG